MRQAIVVCGPTASGKSDLSDRVAGTLVGLLDAFVPVLVFDSMQVYEEIPITTNQARSRQANLVGVCSVFDEWTVASHIKEASRILKSYDPLRPVVMDAGSGMYLNAMLLDMTLYPKVSQQLREKALSMASGVGNVRREARKIELDLSGTWEDPGSIWEGDLLYDTTLVYLRPEMEELEKRISERSAYIVNKGLPEVSEILRAGTPNASVRDSIGFRELRSLAKGEVSEHEAEIGIFTRTRRLARRQIRWFDKLAATIKGRADILILQNQDEEDIIRTVSKLCDKIVMRRK